MDTRAAALAALRERIRAIEGKSSLQKERVPTGLPAVDDLVRGLPCPGILEICGPPGAGRTRLALQVAARFTAKRALVAWIDHERRLYPPAAAALGIALDRFLIVRPPGDQGTWAAEQVIRSGNFAVVVVADPSSTRRAGQRWALAAEYGRCSVLVLRQASSRGVPADIRLSVRDRIDVVRNRGEMLGKTCALPEPPEGCDPWR